MNIIKSGMNKRILIIEDNKLLSETIKELLELNGYSVVKVLNSGQNLKNHITETSAEMILMDIRIEGHLDGIDLAKKIREFTHLPIIFISSFTDSQIINRVKEVKPEGFIIKPFSQEVLTTTIDLVFSKFYSEIHDKNNEFHKPTVEDTFFIRDRGWLRKIKIKDIQYIKTEGTYSHIITNNQTFTLRSPIKDIAPNLPTEYFKRVHKSFIVNINNIEAISPKELKINDEILPVGRNYYPDLQNMIQKLNDSCH